jgi:hypothetical protein
VWLLNHFLELSPAEREKKEFLLISPRLWEVLSLHYLFISKCFGGGTQGKSPSALPNPLGGRVK